MSRDVLALIDEAVEDWAVSQDAMRWVPVWDEPIVRSPRTAIEHLTHAGWDGYAARAYPPIAIRQIGHVIGEAVENIGRAFKKLMPTVVDAAERLQAAQRAADARVKPAPFWTVQPQRQRRTR